MGIVGKGYAVYSPWVRLIAEFSEAVSDLVGPDAEFGFFSELAATRIEARVKVCVLVRSCRFRRGSGFTCPGTRPSRLASRIWAHISTGDTGRGDCPLVALSHQFGPVSNGARQISNVDVVKLVRIHPLVF